MTKQQIADLALVVDRIAEFNAIEVVSHSRGGRAWRGARRIAIRPVKSEITFAIAMHELGHILGPMQSGCRLEKEAGAWVWARENSPEWTVAMNVEMRRLLNTYVAWAKRKGPRAKVPPKDHVLWSLLAPNSVLKE